MQQVEWAEFELQDLFEIQNTLSFNKDLLVEGDEYDYVTRTSQNQGILQTTGFVNKENINSAGNWSLGLLQMDFFYREKPWYAGQFVRKIVPKVELKNKSLIVFLSTLLNQQKSKLLSVLVRDVDSVFRKLKISLPIKSDSNSEKTKQIDFDFIEQFIGELETIRLSQLDNYLSVTGLKDYTLTDNERQVLTDFQAGKVTWSEYKMADLFDKIQTKKLPYQAKSLPTEPTGEYILPCLTSSFKNQGLNYFAPIDGATVLKNVISIPSNSDVYRAYFQSRDFTVLSDAYAIKWRYDEKKYDAKLFLFMVACINQVTDLPIYSYKNKLGGWNVVKDKYIQLLTKNNLPDISTMQTLISALQKLMIKDVVNYSSDKMAKTD